MKLSLLSEALEAPDNDDDQFGTVSYQVTIYIKSGHAGWPPGQKILADVCSHDWLNCSLDETLIHAFSRIKPPIPTTDRYYIVVRDHNSKLFDMVCGTLDNLRDMSISKARKRYAEYCSDDQITEALEAPDNDEDEFGGSIYYAELYLGNTLMVQIDGEILETAYNSANGVTLEAINEVGLDKNGTGDFTLEIAKYDNTGLDTILVTVSATSLLELKQKALTKIKANCPEDWNDEALDDR